MGDTLNDILRAADKHPNSKVSKLIRLVEEEPSQKNIVMLLIELSDHAEYATDFNISLRYYLDLFEKVGISRELLLNEAGLLLVNSSKIYSKRVDYVQSFVERQILTLSNADSELKHQKLQAEQGASGETTTAPMEKTKRGKKRALETHTDPYEIQLEPKKFKKMTEEKRFTPIKTTTKAKPLFRNIEMEQQLHPAGWKYATIIDLENEEDVDTKRNYKLFTYHIEHRYNTLVPDINFRLHFKVKDFMDAQEEELMDVMDDSNNHVDRGDEWSSHCEEYVRKYISLENRVLQREIDPNMPYVSPKRSKKAPIIEDNLSATITLAASADNSLIAEEQQNPMITNVSITQLNISANEASLRHNDSGLGASDIDTSLDVSTQQDTMQQEICNPSEEKTQEAKKDESVNCSQTLPENDSALGESLLDQTCGLNESQSELTISCVERLSTSIGYAEELEENVPENDISGLSNTTIGKGLCDEGDSAKSGDLKQNVDNLADPTEETTCTVDKSAATKDDSASNTNCVESTNTNTPDNCNKNSSENTESSDKSCAEVDSQTTTAGNANTVEEKNGNMKKTNGEQPISSTETSTNGAKEKSTGNTDTFQVEIEVLDDEGIAESNTIQIKIPNSTDDEGCHLSDAYEDDFRLLSPSLNVPNIMPGIQRKDVTIYLDKELREALELHDNMVDHFSQETYKVPVVIEPKEQPLIFNIFQLPPKVLKRKCLFKLGPEMSLYLKARMQKSTKLAKEIRNPRQFQFFPLNNTDMNGILETPPQSPGNVSEFLGFTDDDDTTEDGDETTCGEFCGFTEDEQKKLLLNHRLSRDSGVGVDVATLTPEKEPVLEVIFEDNGPVTSPSCAVDLGKAFEEAAQPDSDGTSRENTNELLNSLPTSIRNILEDEINLEGKSICGDKNKDGEINDPNADSVPKEAIGESNSLIETNVTKNDQIACDPTPEVIVKDGVTPSLEVSSEDITRNETKDSPNTVATAMPDNGSAKNCCSAINECSEDVVTNNENNNSEADPTTPTGNVNTHNADVDKSCDIDLSQEGNALNDVDKNSESEQENALYDLNVQGAKTKIQQWHEHLRPILAKSRERHHFDVFQLGTEIIDTIRPKDSGQTNSEIVPSFGDIMENKDRSYVSRYFLSTLLLANQGNINISVQNKTSERPSSWSDIQLKLLSTKRHTVAIEDNIGMISYKKQKKSNLSDVDKRKKQNKFSVANKQSSSSSEDEEENETLINVQTNMRTSKIAPAKRPAPSGNPNTITAKRIAEDTSPSTMLGNKVSIINQIELPPLDIMSLMPSTSNKQPVIANCENYENAIHQIRILQPIAKLSRPQGDDLDSGIFSVEEMSTS